VAERATFEGGPGRRQRIRLGQRGRVQRPGQVPHDPRVPAIQRGQRRERLRQMLMATGPPDPRQSWT
jgi:hypothetical protein